VVDLQAVAVTLPLATQLVWPARVLAAEDPITQRVEMLHVAINGPDVDASAKTFSEDAVVLVPRVGGLPQIYIGHQQIRWWLSNLMAQHAHFELASGLRADGNHVHWSDAFSVDAFRQLGVASVDVNADAVLTSDRYIQSLTIVLTPEAARNLAVTPGSALESANRDQDASIYSVLLAAVLVCIGFGVGLASALLLEGRRLTLPASQRAADRIVWPGRR
jgi:hypothetical protein